MISYISIVTSETTSSSSSNTSGSSSTTESPTMVWVTGTDASGITRTTQSTYYQSFASMYTSTESPESASIGMGSISDADEVGRIRSYERTTITQTGSANSYIHNNYLFSRDLSVVKFITLGLISLITFIVVII
ncbi:unnamed protein product [Candida verbasci]|uniref:Uncharacterized protein n=1 Tax=Candida verbasci TaxID=1227364 RepID=A0A9W4TS89_9ASCO|nr:unnamed protein product [Candida verbasci]